MTEKRADARFFVLKDYNLRPDADVPGVRFAAISMSFLERGVSSFGSIVRCLLDDA